MFAEQFCEHDPVKAAVQAKLKEIEAAFIWGQVKVIDYHKGEIEWTMHCISDEDWVVLQAPTEGDK